MAFQEEERKKAVARGWHFLQENLIQNKLNKKAIIIIINKYYKSSYPGTIQKNIFLK
jgi:hypothetical protein